MLYICLCMYYNRYMSPMVINWQVSINSACSAMNTVNNLPKVLTTTMINVTQ